MSLKIALAGNPNSGKTTLFNQLTGSKQHVGNWPGVTVEKKEGKLKGREDVIIQDLPGIYSLSPYSPEEVVSREYLLNERPDVVLNIVDGTNIERNLYLTTQILALGIPVVIALNMIDVVKKNGDKIDVKRLSKSLNCPVYEISAIKGTGCLEAANAACEAASKAKSEPLDLFTGSLREAILSVENLISPFVDKTLCHFYAVKLFEKDEKIIEELKLSNEILQRVNEIIKKEEAAADDDAESLITSQRYEAIGKVVKQSVVKKSRKDGLSLSDKIDKIVTNRILALPIFAIVMFIVYGLSMGGWSISIGSALTDFVNDGIFGDGWFIPFTADKDQWESDTGDFDTAAAIIEAYEGGQSEAYIFDDESGETEIIAVSEALYNDALLLEEPNPSDYGKWVPGIPVLVGDLLERIGCNEALSSLILDGIIAGVGAVLGFVPQMLVLFFLLAILEDLGYMSRIAFIMDRIFRRFGLSGKSFIPLLVATGCGVPGVMASRAIEQDKDRKLTIMTTCFMPCGAKAPIIALFAGAVFGGSPLVAVSAYFIGIASVIISSIILKKFKVFAGEPAPFVMELPQYHMPHWKNVLKAAWERGWSFIKRAGTIILLATIIVWALQSFGFENGSFGMVEDSDFSVLAYIGRAVCWIFTPLGFGAWRETVATVTGLIAKENVVGTMAVLYPGNFSYEIASNFSSITAFSYLLFNLLCAPCFAAIGAIKREMNNPRWTIGAVSYMCLWAYVVSLLVYQLGGLISGEVGFNLFTVVAVAVLVALIYLLFRKGYDGSKNKVKSVEVA